MTKEDKYIVLYRARPVLSSLGRAEIMTKEEAEKRIAHGATNGKGDLVLSALDNYTVFRLVEAPVSASVVKIGE